MCVAAGLEEKGVLTGEATPALAGRRSHPRGDTIKNRPLLPLQPQRRSRVLLRGKEQCLAEMDGLGGWSGLAGANPP